MNGLCAVDLLLVCNIYNHRVFVSHVCTLHTTNEELQTVLCVDCEWKQQAGNVFVASFDWSCSGVCKSLETMEVVHSLCGEGDGAIWNITL